MEGKMVDGRWEYGTEEALKETSFLLAVGYAKKAKNAVEAAVLHAGLRVDPRDTRMGRFVDDDLLTMRISLMRDAGAGQHYGEEVARFELIQCDDGDGYDEIVTLFSSSSRTRRGLFLTNELRDDVLRIVGGVFSEAIALRRSLRRIVAPARAAEAESAH